MVQIQLVFTTLLSVCMWLICRSGFATEQAAYNDAQADLERGFAEVEARLSKSRFLMGDAFTDADLRLFPTVVRYDAVYNSLFRHVLALVSATK
jgi:glutathionyl-hydroquinone reductase